MKIRVVSLNYFDEDDEEELELSDEDFDRGEEVYESVFECIKILSENPDMDWDIHIINDTTDAIKSSLARHDIYVRHPHIVEHEDGSQTVEQYEEYWRIKHATKSD